MFQTPGPANDPIAKANLLFNRGDFLGAARAYRQVLKKQPNQPELLHRLAIAQSQNGEFGAAVRDLEKALRLRPRSPRLLTDLAQVFVCAKRYKEAERTYERAEAADPNAASVLGAKAEFFQLIGEFDKASEAIERGLAKQPDDLRLALAFANLAPRLGADGAGQRRAIELLEPHIDALPQRPATNRTRMAILFRLADQHHRLGEHERAFELYTKANSLSPLRFAPEVHHRAIDRMIAGWSVPSIEAAGRSGQDTDLPVFIVGMPRSGTSLVEQILACHPQVYGAGEMPDIPRICMTLAGWGTDPGSVQSQEPMITDPSTLKRPLLERHARTYLAQLRKLDPKAKRVTDKMPNNFMNLGLISLMLPGSRIIHCTRDPLDTCMSCYFQDFSALFPWSYRQEWIGAYYCEYQRLMKHWLSVLPDTPILEVPYEALVADQETWSRKLVDFAQLEWDSECLRFHESKRITATLSSEQVRRPMYNSSIGRHRDYLAHLAPLRTALGTQ